MEFLKIIFLLPDGKQFQSWSILTFVHMYITELDAYGDADKIRVMLKRTYVYN
jgi:hypothetical protein